MENKNIKWKGDDASLTECIDNYGFVYQYDGENFIGWTVDELDENGNFIGFAPFSMDNEIIDDYFEEDGDKIAQMCGVDKDEMDYEWKFSAILSYYGANEFTDSIYNRLTRDELYDKCKENWFGSLD